MKGIPQEGLLKYYKQLHVLNDKYIKIATVFGYEPTDLPRWKTLTLKVRELFEQETVLKVMGPKLYKRTP